MGLDTILYQPEIIDRLCSVLGYDERDRRYMYLVFRRRERGEATRPGQTLLDVARAIGAPALPEMMGAGAKAAVDFSTNNGPSQGAKRALKIARSCHERSETKCWRLGCSFFVTPGVKIDAGLAGRAKWFVVALEGRGRVDKYEGFFLALANMYGDLPQVWAAWDGHSDYLQRRPPAEQRTFFPKEAEQFESWLYDAIDRNRSIVFLVPLVRSPSASELLIPDLPGPGDRVLSRQRLFEVSNEPGS